VKWAAPWRETRAKGAGVGTDGRVCICKQRAGSWWKMEKKENRGRGVRGVRGMEKKIR
jgi:hypothetical protein